MKAVQRRTRFVVVAMGLCALLGVGAAACANLGHTQEMQTADREHVRAVSRARYERDMHLHGLIRQERFEEAKVVIRRMIAHPETDHDVVEGHRLLSMICRVEGDIDGAESALHAAMTECDARPALQQTSASTRIRIIGDQAELAACERDDPGQAIQLYDQIIAVGPDAHPREFRTSSQSAAMLCARLGRHAEAVQRMDALLSSAAAADISEDDQIALRSSQASWATSSGDYRGGYERYLALWNEFKTRDNVMVLEAGLQVMRGLPVPQECDRRMQLAREMLNRVQQVRKSASQPVDAIEQSMLSDVEYAVMVVIADSDGCPDPDGLIQRTRAQLGLLGGQ